MFGGGERKCWKKVGGIRWRHWIEMREARRKCWKEEVGGNDGRK